MIPLEGRALAGLDEFMLRLGHLTVLCQAAVESGGSSYRFTRDLSQRLSRRLPVPASAIRPVVNYLRKKKLCPEEDEVRSPSFEPKDFRYPDLMLVQRGKEYVVESATSESTDISISWQDLCLAADGVPSRVGSVTVQGKRGSKTGLSHIVDWAAMLDLTNASGVASTYGYLLAKFDSATPGRSENPYLLGNERLVLGELLIRNDFDVFAELVRWLSDVGGPLRKKEATQLYIDAVQNIADRAENARHLSQRQRHGLHSLWRDLRRSGRPDEIIASTAWHRAASRFETLVDLGLLRKGVTSEDERYEYKYYVTDALRAVHSTLVTASDSDHWLNEHLVELLLGRHCSREPYSPSELMRILPAVVASIARPTSPLPIRALATGLVWLAADIGQPVSLGAAVRSLEELATQRPDIARLSTGSTTKAEYISIRVDGARDGGNAGSTTV